MGARLLLVTDVGYQAAGRPEYGDEDVWLAARLRADFRVASCHPADAAALMGAFDVVLLRNTGPVLGFAAEWTRFRRTALAAGTRVFPELTGRGDMAGKQYLLEMTEAGFPVIPTVDRVVDVGRLPVVDRYVVKPKLGADSLGLRFVSRDELAVDGTQLVQPEIDFVHEISFYYVDRTFCYALYAPEPSRRWELVPYSPSAADLAFAARFVAWNSIEHGIQRVDACRTVAGELLLVELEDLNPYLSLDRVPRVVAEEFAVTLSEALTALRRKTPVESPVETQAGTLPKAR